VILTNTRFGGDDKKSTAFLRFDGGEKNVPNGILMRLRAEWNRKKGGKTD